MEDIWEDITDEICATIAEEPVVYDTDSVGRTFAEVDGDGRSIPQEPSLEQNAEDTQYAIELSLGTTQDCHQSVTDFTEGSSEVMELTPRGEAGVNMFDLNPLSKQSADGHQRSTSYSEASRYTLASLPTMTQSSNGTATPRNLLDAATSMTQGYSDGSPTPAAATIIEGYAVASSPTTPTTHTIAAKSPKRKLSFGMPAFGGVEDARMPPPKLKKASLTLEDQIFLQFVNADAVADTSVEVTFKDIPRNSMTYTRIDDEVPKTPILFEFGLLPSSAVNIEDTDEESYPVCRVAPGIDIPDHHLKSLRKTVDPTFKDDHHWGNCLYFSEEPAPSAYCESPASKIHSLDWRIIFHALENDADRRIPLPDITSKPQMSDEQRDQICLRFQGGDSERATNEAQMARDWTAARMTRAGAFWTEIRGSYYPEPPEFATRSSQDICAEPGFKLFCSIARFVPGRAAVKPNDRATLSLLQYARLAKTTHAAQTDQPLRQPLQRVRQQSPPANTPLPYKGVTVSENDNPLPPWSSPAPSATEAPTPTFSQQASAPMMPQVPRPVQNNMPLVVRAFNDINAFSTLPRHHLFGLQQQFLRYRAQIYMRQNLPVSINQPTVHQLWDFFRRQCLQRNSVARRQRTATEGAVRAGAQASLVRIPFVGQPVTPVLGRAVQLQSHMPTTPGSRGGIQGNRGGGNVAVTSLGSPFRTPARVRSGSIDPRLLSS